MGLPREIELPEDKPAWVVKDMPEGYTRPIRRKGKKMDALITPNEYQQFAKRTLLERPQRQFRDEEQMKVWCALGLVGEAGEVAELVKKTIYHDHPLDLDKLKKEIGDVMWYLSCIAHQYDIKLDEVMVANIEKLRQRYPEGFSTEHSRNRKKE